MNKMSARITKVSDEEVVHSSVGAVVIVLVGGRRVQAAGKWDMGNNAR
jgi:hypothetical protein